MLMLVLFEPGGTDCQRVPFAASVIASEGARQPLEAQVNIARAVRDNAPCGDSNYLSGYGAALRRVNPSNHHWRAYFAFHSFAEELQEQWLRAATIAYTEEPRIPVRHFDRADGNAWWWDSPRACPNGHWIIGDLKFC